MAAEPISRGKLICQEQKDEAVQVVGLSIFDLRFAIYDFRH